MTVVAQPPIISANLTIHCNEKWTCCQRQQAKEKVEKIRDNIRGRGTESAGHSSRAGQHRLSLRTKAAAQKAAWKTFRSDLKAAGTNKAKRRKAAKDAGASDCLADEYANAPPEPNAQMDHSVEVKFGGPANTPLSFWILL